VNCAAVRDRLPEHSLGVVVGREGDAVDRHLEWCAACRKEARDLRRAAAVLPYALPPVEPPADLEDRVVAAVVVASGSTRPEPVAPRRSRLATVTVLAAVFAVSALGWGAVMAGRASRAEQTVVQEKARSESLARFQQLVEGLEFSDADVELGLLAPTADGSGASGTAATIIVPSANDAVLLVANGLDAERAPYSVELRGGPEDSLSVGAIQSYLIASDGSAEISANPSVDLRRFDRVVVLDVDGTVVLRGALEAQAPVPSPSP
jgi:hypothetical protein